MQSKIINSLRNVFFGLVAKILQLFLPFAVRTVVIYKLGIEYAGLNSLFVSIFNILNLTELGIGAALNFFMYKPVAENDDKTVNAIINLYNKWYRNIGLIICAIGLAITPFIEYIFKERVIDSLNVRLLYLIYFIGMAAPYFIRPYSTAVLSVHQREDIISKVASITIIVQSILQIAAVMLMDSYYLFSAAIVFASFFNSIVIYLCCRKNYPQYKCEGKISDELMGKVKTEVQALFMHKIGNTVLFSADNIVISWILGLTALGIYGNYYLVVTSLSGFIEIIFNSFRASVGNSLVINSSEKNLEDFKRIYFWNITLLGVCTSVLLCVFQRFIVLWVGGESVLQFHTMILICVLFYVLRMGDTVGMYRTALGLWDKDKWRPIISSLCNLAINIFLTNLIGIDGVIISSVLCLVVFHYANTARILYHSYFQKSSRWYYLFHIKSDFINGLAGIISVLFCQTAIKADGFGGIILCGVSSAIISAIVIYMFNIKNEYLKEAYDVIRKKIRLR